MAVSYNFWNRVKGLIMCNKSCSNYLHYTFKGHCADDFDICGQDHKIMSDLQQVLGGCRCSLKSYLQKSYLQKSLKNGVFSIKFCFKIYFTTFFAKLLSSHLPSPPQGRTTSTRSDFHSPFSCFRNAWFSIRNVFALLKQGICFIGAQSCPKVNLN